VEGAVGAVGGALSLLIASRNQARFACALHGDLERAKELLEEARARNVAGDPWVLDEAGMLYVRLGEPELARASWERFISYLPKEPYAYVVLSILTADTEPEQSRNYLGRREDCTGGTLTWLITSRRRFARCTWPRMMQGINDPARPERFRWVDTRCLWPRALESFHRASQDPVPLVPSILRVLSP